MKERIFFSVFCHHEIGCRPPGLLSTDINKLGHGDWKFAMEEYKKRYLILVGHKQWRECWCCEKLWTWKWHLLLLSADCGSTIRGMAVPYTRVDCSSCWEESEIAWCCSDACIVFVTLYLYFLWLTRYISTPVLCWRSQQIMMQKYKETRNPFRPDKTPSIQYIYIVTSFQFLEGAFVLSFERFLKVRLNVLKT